MEWSIISHLDYCNSLLCGPSAKDIGRLRRLQHATAQIIVSVRVRVRVGVRGRACACVRASVCACVFAKENRVSAKMLVTIEINWIILALGLQRLRQLLADPYN